MGTPCNIFVELRRHMEMCFIYLLLGSFPEFLLRVWLGSGEGDSADCCEGGGSDGGTRRAEGASLSSRMLGESSDEALMRRQLMRPS